MMFNEKIKLQRATVDQRQLESPTILDISKYTHKFNYNENSKHVLHKIVFGAKKQFIQVEIFDTEIKINFIHNRESLMRTMNLIAEFHALDSYVLGFSLKNGYEKTGFLCSKIFKANLKRKSNKIRQHENHITTNYIEGYFVNYINESSDVLRILTSKDIYTDPSILVNMGSVNAFHLGYITRPD